LWTCRYGSGFVFQVHADTTLNLWLSSSSEQRGSYCEVLASAATTIELMPAEGFRLLWRMQGAKKVVAAALEPHPAGTELVVADYWK
jgi:hypothetical protein